VDDNIYADDERKRQAEKEDIRTVAGKREVIRDLFNGMRDEMLDRAPKMPQEWDGYEIRWLAADMATERRPTWEKRSVDGYAAAKRLRDYENERIVRNL
jgi:hypothetical protein